MFGWRQGVLFVKVQYSSACSVRSLEKLGRIKERKLQVTKASLRDHLLAIVSDFR